MPLRRSTACVQANFWSPKMLVGCRCHIEITNVERCVDWQHTTVFCGVRTESLHIGQLPIRSDNTGRTWGNLKASNVPLLVLTWASNHRDRLGCQPLFLCTLCSRLASDCEEHLMHCAHWPTRQHSENLTLKLSCAVSKQLCCLSVRKIKVGVSRTHLSDTITGPCLQHKLVSEGLENFGQLKF